MYKKIYKNMCFLSILTLLLTAIMILSACSSTLFSKLKEELEKEAVLFSDILNASNNTANILRELNLENSDKQLMLISPDRKIIYFSDKTTDAKNISLDSCPDIEDAIKNNIGFSQQYSLFSTQNTYSYSVKLKDSSILRISTSTKAIFSFILTILFAVFFLLIIIYIFTILIAMRLTDNIIKPIENVYSFNEDSFDGVYEEIKPFLDRIALQNKEIKRQIEKVKRQKTRLQAITDNMNEGLIIIDSETSILSMNNCSFDIFDVNEYNYKYKKIFDITENPVFLEGVQKALDGKKNDIITTISAKTYQIFLSPVQNDKETSGVIMLLFDISAKADSEHMRREFTANVSHELKTPLTSIHGFAQIITSGLAKPEDIIGFAEKIEKESSRLIVLIDDIIKLSKLDENAMQNDKQEIHIKPIVLQVCENLDTNARSKNINVDIIGNDFSVYANQSQITEMIYNLCDNAIKYNNPNGSIKITLSEKSITIADTGIGIPEKYIGRIYERFFRVDKSHSKKVNGTGLGLSIVKHIAQINNAVINVKSELGKGTVFTVYFSDDESQSET
ncbi:MAG: ATP-binding protein [Clostridia bacterium]|nr:ATP-binding protein [Clostridia bacterium]